MASEESSACNGDPNFAVICSFLTRYGDLLGITDVSISDLEKWLEDMRSVSDELLGLILRLLRRWKSNVRLEKWQNFVVKYCHTYSDIDAWEVERVGFTRCKVSTKLRIIKNLFESQFDCNNKFKEKINDNSAQELRYLPLGRDKNGLAYWYILDEVCNVRVYREEQDDEDATSWEAVVKSRADMASLIEKLKLANPEEAKDVKEESCDSADSPATSVSGVKSEENETKVKAELKEEEDKENKPSGNVKSEVKSEVKVKSESRDLKLETKPVDEVEIKQEPTEEGTEESSAADTEQALTSKAPSVDDEREAGSISKCKENCSSESAVEIDTSKVPNAEECKDTSNKGDSTKKEAIVSTKLDKNVKNIKAQQTKDVELGIDAQCEEDAIKTGEPEPAMKNESIEKDTSKSIATHVESQKADSDTAGRSHCEPSGGQKSENCDDKVAETEIKAKSDEEDKAKQNVDKDLEKDQEKTSSTLDQKSNLLGTDRLKTRDVADDKIKITEKENTEKESQILSDIKQKVIEASNKEKEITVGEDESEAKSEKKEVVSKEAVGTDRESTDRSEEGAESKTKTQPKDGEKQATAEDGEKQATAEGGEKQATAEAEVTESKEAGNKNKQETAATSGEVSNDIDGKHHYKKTDNAESVGDKTDKSHIGGGVGDGRKDRKRKENVLETHGEKKKDDIGAGDMPVMPNRKLKKATRRLFDKTAAASAEAKAGESTQEESGEKEGEKNKKEEVAVTKTIKKKSKKVPKSNNKRKRGRGKETGTSEEEEEKEEEESSIDSKTESEETISQSDEPPSKRTKGRKLTKKAPKQQNHDSDSTDSEPARRKKASKHKTKNESDASDSEPLVKRKSTKSDEVLEKKEEKTVGRKKAAKHKKKVDLESSDSEPLVKKKATKKKDDDDSETSSSEKKKEGNVDSDTDQSDSEKSQVKGVTRGRGRVQGRGRGRGRGRSHGDPNGVSTAKNEDDDASPAGTRTRSRGRGRGRPRGKGQGSATVSCDNSNAPSEAEEEEVTVRRSSRSNKGQRTALFVANSEELERLKQREEQQKLERLQREQEREARRLARKARKFEYAKKKAKKSRLKGDVCDDDDDDDYQPSPGGKKRNSQPSPGGRKKKRPGRRPLSGTEDDESSENEEDFFSPDDEPLHWSSLSETEDELDSNGEEYVPKGRNAQRAARIKEENVDKDGNPCIKCSKYDHPEWILLCDKCDGGYHTSCLRPPIMIIPDDDWYCPPCEHNHLIAQLSSKLKDLDILLKKNARVIQRKERLAFVGINLDNILAESPSDSLKKSKKKKHKHKKHRYNDDRDDEPRLRRSRRYINSEEEEDEETEVDDTFVLLEHRSQRKRKEISYKFEEYDELIKTAIEDGQIEVFEEEGAEEVEAPEEPAPQPQPAKSRGKDMAIIIAAASTGTEDDIEYESKPSPVSQCKKKSRKLNSLDDEEEGDEDDSEEYKASEDTVSEASKEEVEEECLSAESDLDTYRKKNQRNRQPTRRSTRTRRRGYRFDDFIVDGDSADESSDSSGPAMRRTRKVDYREDTDDSEASGLAKKAKRKQRNNSDTSVEESEKEVKPRKRRSSRYEDDSEFSASDGSDHPAKSRRKKKVISSDEDESLEKSKPASKNLEETESEQEEEEEVSDEETEVEEEVPTKKTSVLTSNSEEKGLEKEQAEEQEDEDATEKEEEDDEEEEEEKDDNAEQKKEDYGEDSINGKPDTLPVDVAKKCDVENSKLIPSRNGHDSANELFPIKKLLQNGDSTTTSYRPPALEPSNEDELDGVDLDEVKDIVDYVIQDL